jgi:hypothetical protein
MFCFRLRMQLAEALGEDNRWFCSREHGYEVHDPDLLVKHFVKKGGAADFARRFAEAMGEDNRWYCSEHHGYEVRDPERLWKYYVRSTRAATRREHREKTREREPELCLT